MKKGIVISSIFTESFSDYPDNKSTAIIIYFVGCSNKCPGCHNASTLVCKDLIEQECIKHPEYICDIWDYSRGNYNINLLKYIIFKDDDEINLDNFLDLMKNLSSRFHTNKFIFQGGDPLYIDNINLVKNILNKKGDFNICLYTGSSISKVKALKLSADFYKCGKFDSNHYQKPGKNEWQMSLASTNQNFFNKKYKKISKNGILRFAREKI